MHVSTERHPKHGTAVLLLLLATVFWGLSFPSIRAAALLHRTLIPESRDWFVTAMVIAPRFAIAAVVMACWQGTRLLAMTGKEIRQGVIIGAFAAGGIMLQSDGLQFTHASTSAFLTQLYVVLIPLWVALR